MSRSARATDAFAGRIAFDGSIDRRSRNFGTFATKKANNEKNNGTLVRSFPKNLEISRASVRASSLQKPPRKQTARFFFENIAFPRARSRASPLSPAAADRAADRTRAPRLVSRLSARSGPDSAFLEAPFEFREALAFRRFEVSPRDREKADASHGRAVLRVACRARSGRVPAIARVPATPRRGERPQESGRRAQRQGGDEVDGPPAVS